MSGHFFANCMFVFHKTEVQTVILRCLTSLDLDWYTRYDTKRKNTKIANECFCTKLQKKRKWKIVHFVPLTLNQSDFKHVKHIKMTF